MAFELYNFNCHAVECTISPFGIIRVPPGAYVPTPEQESKGITADAFKDFQPSFLRAVAPAERGRLLEKEGLEIAEDLVATTSPLPDSKKGSEITEQKKGQQEAGPDPGAEEPQPAVAKAEERALEKRQDKPRSPVGTDEVPRLHSKRDSGQAIGAPSVCSAILDFVSSQPDALWRGTCSELLDGLMRYAGEQTQGERGWPHTSQQMGRLLRRFRVNFEQAGFEVKFWREGKFSTRMISIMKQG